LVTMTSSDQAPAGLELKAPVALAPRPEVSAPASQGAVSVDPSRATVTMIAAVTGTVDEVGDRIIPGCLCPKSRQQNTQGLSGPRLVDPDWAHRVDQGAVAG